MPRRLLLALSAGLVLSAAEPPVSLRVYPSIIPENGSVHLTCRVSGNPANRWITLGVTGYTASTYELAGADAPLYHERWFHRVPCGSNEVFCQAIRTDGADPRTSSRVIVAGCRDVQP